MHRYTAASVIQLPRLQSSGAMALGEQLITAARPFHKTLPKPVAKALATLSAAHRELVTALRDRVPIDAADPVETVQLDRTLDAFWSATHAFLGAFAKLPGAPEAIEAAALQ